MLQYEYSAAILFQMNCSWFSMLFAVVEIKVAHCPGKQYNHL